MISSRRGIAPLILWAIFFFQSILVVFLWLAVELNITVCLTETEKRRHSVQEKFSNETIDAELINKTMFGNGHTKHSHTQRNMMYCAF